MRATSKCRWATAAVASRASAGTLQRRFQKLVEIAPPLAARAAARQIKAALRGKAVGYQSLGTFGGRRTFGDALRVHEANPRLQVEHTVTELTGLDLVQPGRHRERPDAGGPGTTRPPRAARLRVQWHQCRDTRCARQCAASGGTLARSICRPVRACVSIRMAMRASRPRHYDTLLAKLIVHSSSPRFCRRGASFAARSRNATSTALRPT